MLLRSPDFITGTVPWGDEPPIPFVSTEEALAAEDQAHLYMGLGEQEASARAALTVLGGLGIHAVAVAMPYHKVKPVAMPLLTRGGVLRVADELVGDGAAVDLLGTSRGGISVTLAAATWPERVKAVGLMSPAGVTNELLGSTPMQRNLVMARDLGVRNTFRARDPRLAYAQPSIVGEITTHAMRRQLFEGLHYALAPWLGKEVQQGLVAIDEANIPLRLFAASRDPFFRYEHYKTILAGLGLEHILEETPGAHPVLLTRIGQQQLRYAGQWLLNAHETQTTERAASTLLSQEREVITVSPTGQTPLLPEAGVRTGPRQRIRKIAHSIAALTLVFSALGADRVSHEDTVPAKPTSPTASAIQPTQTPRSSAGPRDMPRRVPGVGSVRVPLGLYDAHTGSGTVIDTVRTYARANHISANDHQVWLATDRILAAQNVGGKGATPKDRWEAATKLPSDFEVTLSPQYFH